MKWKAVVLAILVLFPAAITFGVALSARMANLFGTAVSRIIGEPRILLDPVDDDVPGGDPQST